jgi:hypothetical protein
MLPAGSARRRALLQRRRDVGRIRFCAQDFWAERPSVIVICKLTWAKALPDAIYSPIFTEESLNYQSAVNTQRTPLFGWPNRPRWVISISSELRV